MDYKKPSTPLRVEDHPANNFKDRQMDYEAGKNMIKGWNTPGGRWSVDDQMKSQGMQADTQQLIVPRRPE